MSGNDYTRYLSAGSRKSYGSKKSSSRRSNPRSSSNSQMAKSSAVPNSQTQPSPPAPAQASSPAPAPAQAPPAPAPSQAPPAPAPSQAPPAPAPAQAPPAPAPAQAPPPPAPNAAAMTLEDLATINMILASPGHHLLPHLHPNRPPNTVWFDEDGSVAASVRQIFERDFKEPHASWKQTPGNVVRRWFESFAQMYHWDSGFTSLVRDSFEAKLKVQMNRQVCRWKKVWRVKGDAAMPVWFDPNVWAGLVTYWLDPGTEVRNCNSRAARYSDPDRHGPSKHRSGQTSYKLRCEVAYYLLSCDLNF
ncbi:formin-like protein 4 [Brassica napus]|uniref:formin-like protein 4 n=1 Tax=Brassica napus TaxID=3708 RepID=UPI002078FAF8|nr:formin-like protein 4 [Brassica napus]